MLVKGDLKCLHCGFVSCQWTGARGVPLTFSGVAAEQRPDGSATDAVVRCARCAGPVFLDDVELVISANRIRRIRRLREQIAALDARRGRAA